MRLRGNIVTPRRQYDHFPIKWIRANRGIGLIMDAIYNEALQGKTHTVFYEMSASRANCLRRLGFRVASFSYLAIGRKKPVLCFSEVSWADSKRILPGVF